MTKSRMAALPFFLLCSLPVQPAWGADPLTAEQAIRNQRDGLRGAVGIGCQRGEGEIVVCARGRGRLAFPEEEGARKRLIAGETGSAADAANLGACCQPRGGIDVLKVGSLVAKGLGKIF